MTRLLLDTNAWAMMTLDDPRLVQETRLSIKDADDVAVSAISFYEIGQKVRLGKWPEMAALELSLPEVARRDGLRIIPVSPQIALDASLFEWAHRDPFDRIIWMTARSENMRIVSSDVAFDTLDSSLRIWH